jgi:hypothetical protein
LYNPLGGVSSDILAKDIFWRETYAIPSLYPKQLVESWTEPKRPVILLSKLVSERSEEVCFYPAPLLIRVETRTFDRRERGEVRGKKLVQ